MSMEYDDYRELVGNHVPPIAAAILVLSQRVDILLDDDLVHQIALGLRKGLFGASAMDNASIDNTAQIVADGMENGNQ